MNHCYDVQSLDASSEKGSLITLYYRSKFLKCWKRDRREYGFVSGMITNQNMSAVRSNKSFSAFCCSRSPSGVSTLHYYDVKQRCIIRPSRVIQPHLGHTILCFWNHLTTTQLTADVLPEGSTVLWKQLYRGHSCRARHVLQTSSLGLIPNTTSNVRNREYSTEAYIGYQPW